MEPSAKIILLFVLCTIIPDIVMGFMRLFVKPKNMDPNKFPVENLHFFLFTKRNQDQPQQLFVNDQRGLAGTNFNPNHPLKVVIHGWKNDNVCPVCILIRRGFLKNGEYNVLLIDWSKTASENYIHAANRVVAIAAYVGRMIDFLVESGCDPNTISVIGHSLGAHIAGLTRLKGGRKIKHVVGLDPAKPGFDCKRPDSRISQESAEYVEVIHTNGGKYGVENPLGHADFFVNGGGPSQPGCDGDKDAMDQCAHSRAYEYFAESLHIPNQWLAVKCGSANAFYKGDCNSHIIVRFPGSAADINKPPGTYYLRTLPGPPYGIGIQGTKPWERI